MPSDLEKIQQLTKFYKYYGGDDNCEEFANNYFESHRKNNDIIPEYQSHCQCGTKITLNYYIKHRMTGDILVVGSKCISQFKINCDRCKTWHLLKDCPIDNDKKYFKKVISKELIKKVILRNKRFRNKKKKKKIIEKLEKKLVPIILNKINKYYYDLPLPVTVIRLKSKNCNNFDDYSTYR